MGLCVGECGGKGGDCAGGGCVIGTEVGGCAQHVSSVGVAVLHFWGIGLVSGAVRVIFIAVNIAFIYVIIIFFGVNINLDYV